MKKDVVMTREEFLVYEGHFNAKQYENVVSYFNPDCTVAGHRNRNKSLCRQHLK